MSCTNILFSLPLDLNEVLKELPRKEKLFDARNLRKFVSTHLGL